LKLCDALSVAVFARMGVLEDESTLQILEKLRNRRLRDFMRWGGGYHMEMKWKDELQTRSLLLLRRGGVYGGGGGVRMGGEGEGGFTICLSYMYVE